MSRPKEHPFLGTPFYQKWQSMKSRHRHHQRYKDFFFEPRWNHFIDFFNDMHESYVKHCKEFGERNTTIERIDNTRGYFIGNCRWATYKEQENNRSNNFLIKFNNQKLTLAQWSEKTGIRQDTLKMRIIKLKWTIEKALNAPTRPMNYKIKKVCIRCHKIFNVVPCHIGQKFCSKNC